MFTAAEILTLVDGIYAGILDPTAWEAAILGLCRAFGGEGAALTLQDAASKEVEGLTIVGVDESYRHSYAELTALPDMRGAYRAVAESAACGAVTAEDVALAAPDFERSRFHTEWLKPQRTLDLIAAPLMPSPGIVGGLFVGRLGPAGQYGHRELDALRLLRPHLLRAVQARLRLDAAASAASAALAALDALTESVLLVDRTSTIVHANRSAEAALRRCDGVTATRSVLACDHADDTAALRRLVGEASAREPEPSGGLMALRRRSGRRPLSALVAPLRGNGPISVTRKATAMVLLADPESRPTPTADALRLVYGLTSAEARTARALLDHSLLADVAGSLGVSLATVRTQLQRTFDKTDTHSQAELVRLMLTLRLPAAPDAIRPPASSARTSPPP